MTCHGRGVPAKGSRPDPQQAPRSATQARPLPNATGNPPEPRAWPAKIAQVTTVTRGRRW
jgi:hypothetical protein